MCGRFYGLKYYLWQILWTKILCVADFIDLDEANSVITLVSSYAFVLIIS